MNVRRVGLAGAVAVVVALGAVVAACGQATAPASQVKVEPALEVSGQSPTSAPLSSDVTSPVTITGMTTDTGGLALTGNLTGTAGLTTTVALTPTELLTTTLDAATFDLLGNLTYTLDGQDFALVNGIFGNPAEHTDVHLVPIAATGDLDGDTQTDAVALLAMSTGGSGTFVYLAAAMNQGGTMVNTDALPIGDRVQVKAITIDAGVITLAVVTHGPDDPMCCPTLAQEWTFALTDGKLTVTSADRPTTLQP